MNEFFAFSTVADSQGAEPYRPIHILARTISQVFQFCLMLSELAPRRECLLEERISGFCLDHLALLANSKVPRSFE